MQQQLLKYTYSPKGKDIVNIIGIPLLEGAGKKEVSMVLFPNSYRVQVKKRQHVGGKRVRGTEWVTLDGAFASEYEAGRYGKSIIEHNEKASIRIIPSNRKPKKLGKKIKYFDTNPYGYIQKGDIIVEMPINRINTKGEVMNISRLGWIARRKGKGGRRR